MTTKEKQCHQPKHIIKYGVGYAAKLNNIRTQNLIFISSYLIPEFFPEKKTLIFIRWIRVLAKKDRLCWPSIRQKGSRSWDMIVDILLVNCVVVFMANPKWDRSSKHTHLARISMKLFRKKGVTMMQRKICFCMYFLFWRKYCNESSIIFRSCIFIVAVGKMYAVWHISKPFKLVCFSTSQWQACVIPMIPMIPMAFVLFLFSFISPFSLWHFTSSLPTHPFALALFSFAFFLLPPVRLFAPPPTKQAHTPTHTHARRSCHVFASIGMGSA